jgi:hypothetical protein
MTNIYRSLRGAMRSTALLVGVAALPLTACKLDVTNPSVIDAAAFDPTSDGATISLSAQTAWYGAFQTLVVDGGYFAEEATSGAARTETSDIARRNFPIGNPDLSSVFSAMSSAISQNTDVITALEGGPNAASDINLARAQMNLGFSLSLMAESFCEGVIKGGPSLTPAQLLDSAITRFNQAITTAGAASGAEATKIVNASRIGLARAYLQQGDNANALTAATTALGSVPSTFEYNVINTDDQGNRQLGNQVYDITDPNKFLVVPAPYRAMNDPRVPWVDAGVLTQDGFTEDYQQLKYTSYSDPIRIASYLEAQYVQAEASLKGGSGSGPALALIAARRAVGGQGAFTGTTDAAILTELLNQSARDFWLEAKKLGDWRRNGAAEPLISAPGDPYKVTQQFGTLTCFPLPASEVNANPNLH